MGAVTVGAGVLPPSETPCQTSTAAKITTMMSAASGFFFAKRANLLTSLLRTFLLMSCPPKLIFKTQYNDFLTTARKMQDCAFQIGEYNL